VPTDVGEDIPLDSASVWVLPMSEVTRVLSAIEQGDPHAADQLLPLVYDELRRLAAQKLAQERPGQTLEATALVHEAYVRLVGTGETQNWDSRGHFFAGGGTLNVKGCTITGNEAIGGATAQGNGTLALGGGIDNNNNQCLLNLTDSTVSNNLCQAGGWAYLPLNHHLFAKCAILLQDEIDHDLNVWAVRCP
jgi:hypothetical protein